MSKKEEYINDLNKSFSEGVNSIKWTDEPSDEDLDTMRQTPSYMTIDWWNILPEPPANNSQVTIDELKYIASKTKTISYEDFELVQLVDKDPLDLFLRHLNMFGLQFPAYEFKEAYKNTLEPIILNLKWKFKRPRPYQLADKFNVDINVIETDTHQTPAYPSGHAAYGGLIASMLSDLYPKHSSEFYHLASLIEKARILQGVHYPTDNDAGMLIASAVWQDIRYNIFPNLKIGD
jgi:hypothetical protein|tara:strand:+ start:5443 stop:6144 length:702 start_codon:yes stop_codon:yes gene_type:complete